MQKIARQNVRAGALDAFYMIRLYTGLQFTDIRYIGKKYNASHNNNNDYRYLRSNWLHACIFLLFLFATGQILMEYETHESK